MAFKVRRDSKFPDILNAKKTTVKKKSVIFTYQILYHLSQEIPLFSVTNSITTTCWEQLLPGEDTLKKGQECKYT